MDINYLLFDNFETLDLFGPVEVLGQVESYRPRWLSLTGGVVVSSQKVPIVTEKLDLAKPGGLLVTPGGQGTRSLVLNEAFIQRLKNLAEQSQWVLTVCTGSALLAITGLLAGLSATSNKRALEWVKSVGPGVNWLPKARWAVAGKYYTASGVSAGIDMSLGFVRDRFGEEKALAIAQRMEYAWNQDWSKDPFALE
jgi:putative intracellular protease/amidase